MCLAGELIRYVAFRTRRHVAICLSVHYLSASIPRAKHNVGPYVT